MNTKEKIFIALCIIIMTITTALFCIAIETWLRPKAKCANCPQETIYGPWETVDTLIIYPRYPYIIPFAADTIYIDYRQPK